jgi:acetolactate synthase regulatory subunit
MPDNLDQLCALVLMRERPEALLRLLSTCHRRCWTPTALRWATDGRHGEAALRLTGAAGRCTPATVTAQVGRLVDVLGVVCEDEPGLPDDVAFAALRARAPWRIAARGDLAVVPA